jgi:hypothetical protein
MRPDLVLAVVIAGLVGVGWAARTTLAQKSRQKPVESIPAPGSSVGELKALPSAPVPPLAPAPVVSAHSPLELDPTSGLPAPGESDDPEKNVQAFVEQNRKVAETQLKNLRNEAEKLRSRLQKVEAGIRRWESLLTALQTNEAPPGALEPIPSARRGFSARAVPPPVAPAEEGPSSRPAPPDDKPPPPKPDSLAPSPSEPAPR